MSTQARVLIAIISGSTCALLALLAWLAPSPDSFFIERARLLFYVVFGVVAIYYGQPLVDETAKRYPWMKWGLPLLLPLLLILVLSRH